MARYRLLTFNIAHARGPSPVHQGLRSERRLKVNLLKVARLINRVEADVVALQEIDENSRWSGSFNHLEYLREHTQLKYAVHGVNHRWSGRFHLSYGNAFLSRFPIKQHETVVFGKALFGQKGFLFAEIETPAGVLPVINVHLHHQSRAARLRQITQLMSYIDQHWRTQRSRWCAGPVICGDLNNPANQPDATAVLLGYLEQFENYSLFPKGKSPGKLAHTFPALWPQFPLDYVYLPAACVQPEAAVIRCYLSDHRPVLAEFTLTAA